MRENNTVKGKEMGEKGRAIGHTRCVLPAELLVCAQISSGLVSLAAQAGHVAPEDSLAPSHIQRTVFLPHTLSFCLQVSGSS